MAITRLNIFCLLIVFATGMLETMPVLAANTGTFISSSKSSLISAEEARVRKEIQNLTSNDLDVRKQALQYLSDITLRSGSDQLGYLIRLTRAFDNRYEDVRYGIIEIMSESDWSHARNLPNEIYKTYSVAANDSSTRIRLLVVELLGYSVPQKLAEVKKILTARFKDTDVAVRATAIVAWASVVGEKFPPSANPVEILHYKDERTIVNYIYDLKRLKLSNEQNRKLVQLAFRHSSPEVKAAAIHQLIGMINLNNPKLWEKMIVVINASDSPDQVKKSAIDALVNYSQPKNPYLQDTMTRLAKSSDPVIKKAALNALGNIKPNADKTLTEIRQLITSNDLKSQILAVELISKTGVSNTETTKTMVSFLGNEKYDQLLVVAAVKTLSQKNNMEFAVPGLVNVLQNIRTTISPLPASVGSALSNILKNAANPQELAIKITDDILRQWRQSRYPVSGKKIFEAINTMTLYQKYDLQKSPRILEKLCSYYTFDQKRKGRPYSNMTLLIHGRIGESAIDPLIKMLSDSTPEQRACAADALGKYRFWARRAMPALEKLTKDKDQMVSAVARESLKTIADSPRQVKPNFKMQTVTIKNRKNQP